MKILILTIALMIVGITGCSDVTKVETAPWNDEQITQMEADDVNCVPAMKITF